MAANGYVTEEEAAEAAARPLQTVDRLSGATYTAAEYFVENVRRQVFDMYGDETLYSGGLSIRTTLDTTMQLAARSALRAGLEDYDHRHGYHGPLAQIELGEGWVDRLSEVTIPRDMDEGWIGAVVLSSTSDQARNGLLSGAEGTIALSELAWARETLADGAMGPAIRAASDVLNPGDVIIVEALPDSDGAYTLRQVPAINGGILAMDPHTGRVLAMVGGYSFQMSQFNRATQARRQPGSAFKPFVYAAALDNGYTPASLILDAPFVASGGPDERFYMPQNYSERYYGMSTLRLGLELSRNVMTVRLAQEMGMAPIVDYGVRFGIYDELEPVLAMALGSGETTLYRLVSAYSTLVNGGRRVEPTLLDRVQDRFGTTIFAHEQLPCDTCDSETWAPDLAEPVFPETGIEVIDPVTSYQVVHLLEGVVASGTGSALRSIGRPLGGKTGTTNDFRDAWFVGFAPDLVVGVYVGFDTPYQLGPGEAGGRVAAPIVRDFLDAVIDNYPVAPFRVPPGVRLVPIDRATGEPGILGQPGVILEAFRPGTEPTRQSREDESGLSFASHSVSDDPMARAADQDDDSTGDEDDEDDLGGLY
jgi:penicillin-binding protein 1A